MIGKITGRLDWRGSDSVLIDVRGVGYIVHVSDRTLAAMPVLGEAVSLYTELMVREDLLQLFGFPTMLEKEWHRLLVTVQGVGAKAAMSILGTLGGAGHHPGRCAFGAICAGSGPQACTAGDPGIEIQGSGGHGRWCQLVGAGRSG